VPYDVFSAKNAELRDAERKLEALQKVEQRAQQAEAQLRAAQRNGKLADLGVGQPYREYLSSRYSSETAGKESPPTLADWAKELKKTEGAFFGATTGATTTTTLPDDAPGVTPGGGSGKPLTPEQILNMSDKDFLDNEAAILQQAGIKGPGRPGMN